MKRLLVLALAAGIGGATALAPQALAKGRVDAGQSVGLERRAAAGGSSAAKPQAANPTASTGGRIATLAALATGTGLGWLASAAGLGAAAVLFAAALITFAFVALARRGAAPACTPSGFGEETVAAPPPSQMIAPEAPVERRGRDAFPGFDVESFLREAKRNFIRLQEASNRGDFDEVRALTTEEMLDALARERVVRAAPRRTDATKLEAALLELSTERGVHWASVRFSGPRQENARALAASFGEIWHLRKPADGSSGWLLAAIQQIS